jgi:hypothetical protein
MALEQGELIHALDVLTLPPDAPRPEALDPPTLEAAKAARSWITGPNIVGTGIAQRITAGQTTADLALKVYVKKKRPVQAVPSAHLVPSEVQIPGLAEPVSVDVEAIGQQELEVLGTKVRPVIPGYSISVTTVDSTGTLGCLVALQSAPSQPLLLSNAHVISGYGLDAAGTVVIQPGESDQGQPADAIAELSVSVTFDFSPGFNNTCDAAVAKIDPDVSVSGAIPSIGMPKLTPVQPARGMAIQKTGRTTGHTTGIIKDINYRTYMLYPQPGGGYGNAGFRDQVLCTRYSASGDSGSLVCDATGSPIGLHWCGSTSTSVFSPIVFVFDALGLVMWNPGGA